MRGWKASVGIGIAVAAAVAVALILVGHRTRRSATMVVTVAGRPVDVAPGSALGTVVSRLRVRPRAGDLLDVHGRVLRAGAVPGGFLVDGTPASIETVLHSGARVTAVRGKNRTEPVTHSVVRVPGGLPSDPQFFVDRVPGEELIERGAISHELVSIRFRPLGAPRPERAVALTFDDGPSPRYTPRILAELAKLHVRATFFVIGYLARAHPSLVRREAKLGMAVGNHSYNHPEVPPFAQLPAPLIRDEIGLADQELVRLGIRPRLFRPPGGGSSAKLVRIAEALGQRVVLWSVDPTDWEPGVTGAEIARRVLSAVRPGSIVDLHDGGGDRSATLAALPKIVRGIKARGLRLVVLGVLHSDYAPETRK
jgi:peptidoglycan/xylan/chitin deacetylase (PgdA/CDA1 family)